jgi:hypothetical protein
VQRASWSWHTIQSYASEASHGHTGGQISGFFDPSELDYRTRQDMKLSVAEAANVILQRSELCCIYPENVTMTNVCDAANVACLNFMLTADPKDCGDGLRLDPEQVPLPVAIYPWACLGLSRSF